MSEIINPGGGGGSSGLTVGTTTITGGTSGYVLTDNGGVLGNVPPPGLIAAPSNLTFYVSTTGSDSTGDGSSGNPWATVQYAWDVASTRYDWRATYVPTIQVDDGTWTTNGALFVSSGLINPPGPPFPFATIQGNNSTPSNCIIDLTGTLGWRFFNFLNLNIAVTGFHFKVDYQCCSAFYGFFFSADNCIVELVSGSGNGSFIFSGNAMQGFGLGASTGITIIGAANNGDFSCFVNGERSKISTTIVTFNIVVPFSFVIGINSILSVVTASIVNPTNIHGPGYALQQSLMAADCDPLSFPGAAGTTDEGSEWQNTNTSAFPAGVPYFTSGAPTTSNLGTSTWNVFKDITQAQGLGITIKYNDAGTLYNVGGSGGGGGPPLVIF